MGVVCVVRRGACDFSMVFIWGRLWCATEWRNVVELLCTAGGKFGDSRECWVVTRLIGRAPGWCEPAPPRRRDSRPFVRERARLRSVARLSVATVRCCESIEGDTRRRKRRLEDVQEWLRCPLLVAHAVAENGGQWEEAKCNGVFLVQRNSRAGLSVKCSGNGILLRRVTGAMEGAASIELDARQCREASATR